MGCLLGVPRVTRIVSSNNGLVFAHRVIHRGGDQENLAAAREGLDR